MRELRCIIFDDAELIKALVGYRRRTGKGLPPGQITGLEIEKSPEVIARLSVAADSGAPVVVPTAGAELAAAMIAYCIEMRVPVPASSTKSIALIDDHIAPEDQSALVTGAITFRHIEKTGRSRSCALFLALYSLTRRSRCPVRRHFTTASFCL